VDDLDDPLHRRLLEWFATGETGWPEDEALAALMRELGASGLETADWAAEADGAARRLTMRRLQRELRDMRNRLSHAQDDDETLKIQTEIMQLSHSLRELSTR
jgi:hypothetical protein